MATEKGVKNTGRDIRQVMGHENPEVSPAGYTISQPIGTVHGDIPLLEDKPHMTRIVLVMMETLPRVKTEIKQLKISKDRYRTRYTQDFIRVVAEHLPEALKELQTASVNHQTSMFEEKIKKYKEKIEDAISNHKQLLSESKEHEKYLSDEISRISDKLRQAHEKEQQYKDFLLKMQTIIENKKLEITELKRTSVFQAKGIEYQRLEVEISRLLQENKNLNEQLEQARDSANEKENTYEQLNFTMQTLSHQHNEEMKAFKSFCEMQATNRIDELDIEKHNAISLKSALEKENILNHSLKEEKMKIHKERTNLFGELTEIKGHALRQEFEIKHLRSEISKLKLAHGMHEKEIKTELRKAQKQNQQLLLEKTNLSKDLQQENDNVKDRERECYSIKEEMLKLKEKQEKEIQGLKTADDIQRKLNVENDDLKKKMSLLREEKIKLEAYFAHQKENKSEEDANEKELNRQKLAFETQRDALKIEIHKAQQHNQQLLQDVDKLYNELHHEKENSKTLQTKFDVVTKELQKLTATQEEAKLRLKKSDDIQQKVYIENQELKNEVSVQRDEIIKLKTDLTHRQQNEREKHTKEQDINKLKLAYETQQDALNKDIHKAHQQNQELLQYKAKLHNDLQQEKDNAIKIQTEFVIVREELQMLKETHTVARLRLKESDDIRQKVNKENQELKNELSEQRREIMKLKTHLTHRQENERKQNTNEQDIIKLKVAFEMQKEALLREIQDIKHQNQQLLLSNRKLHHDFQQEQDNATKDNTERDAIIAELNQLRTKHQEAIKIIKEAGDFQEKVNAENEGLKIEVSNMRREIIDLNKKLTHQQENANEHDQARSNLKKDMKLLQDQIKQVQTENKKLSKDLDIAKETAKALDKQRSEKSYFQDIITKQEKEISNLRFMLQEQNNVNADLNKEIESANLTVDKCKQQIMKQEQIIETQKRSIAKLESVNKKHDVEGRVANRNADSRNEESDITIKDLQQQLARVGEQLKNVQQELDDTKSSRTMVDKSKDTDIADLSDRNRPTKISERYQELYENQWTDAFEIVYRTIGNEEKTIEALMNILLETMAFCKAESASQMTTLTETLSKEKDFPACRMTQLKNLRKSSAENYGKGLYTEYFSKLNQTKSLATNTHSFVKECFEICWLMVVQDPPVVIGPDIRRDAPFNKDHYKAFTKSGDRIDYVVWPVLLLYQDGPVLCKGVAQGH